MVEDLWLAEIIMMRIKNFSTVMSALFNRRNPSIKTKNTAIISTPLVRHALLNDHQTALQIPELQKHLRTIQKKSTSVQDKAALVLLKCVHWLCVQNITLSKFKSLLIVSHWNDYLSDLFFPVKCEGTFDFNS